jgi:DNA-binding GntR family transcriptional regulator
MQPIAVIRQPLLAVRVEEELREAIMYGGLKLGEAVSEDRLATMLGVSRTPVREALSALALQGLIEIKPQRGSFVFQPSIPDVAELCEYRAIVEGQAMRLAHRRAAEATRLALKAADDAQSRAEDAGDVVAAAKADAAFHITFISHCGNSLLEQAYKLVSGRIGAIRFTARGAVSSRAISSKDHRAIVRAFAKGDLDTAESVLNGHIMRMQPHFAELLSVKELS